MLARWAARDREGGQARVAEESEAGPGDFFAAGTMTAGMDALPMLEFLLIGTGKKIPVLTRVLVASD